MSSEILVRLKCDGFEIKKGAKVQPCEETILITECLMFVTHHEITGKPYSALEYLVPDGWMRIPGKNHYCPKHAEEKKKEKHSLPNFQGFDSNNPYEVHEEPTKKIKLPKPEDGYEPDV